MKYGSIFYKMIVLIDYFCMHFINDNGKQKKRENKGERMKEWERVEKYQKSIE